MVSVNNIITINGLNVSHGQFTHMYDVEEITDTEKSAIFSRYHPCIFPKEPLSATRLLFNVHNP